jgi:hypothetical protein
VVVRAQAAVANGLRGLWKLAAVLLNVPQSAARRQSPAAVLICNIAAAHRCIATGMRSSADVQVARVHLKMQSENLPSACPVDEPSYDQSGNSSAFIEVMGSSMHFVFERISLKFRPCTQAERREVSGSLTWAPCAQRPLGAVPCTATGR